MNLQLTNQNTPTMSSREIAEIVESRHSDIVRSITRLMTNKVISWYAPTAYTHPQNGQTYECYYLNKRDSLIVVAQNCPEFTARIVDRWQELEAQVKPTFMLPQTFAQALALAAQQALELEQKEQQLELAKPKVEYVDSYVERGNLKAVTDVAKEIGVSGKKLGKWLREEGHAWSKHPSIRWTQPFIDSGYGEMKQYTTPGGFDGSQALVTPSGDLFIKQNFSK